MSIESRLRRLERTMRPERTGPCPALRALAQYEIVVLHPGMELVEEQDTDPQTWRSIQATRADVRGDHETARLLRPPDPVPEGLSMHERAQAMTAKALGGARRESEAVEAAIERACKRLGCPRPDQRRNSIGAP